MRKVHIFHYTLSMLSALLLAASCTLSMEEYVVPEEEKGFDEAETVENEFGTMTYQYKEGVRSITENIQEYIIEVEDDSIIYFMENTPEEWLPRVGDKLAAMCLPVIPFGLNHRVINVQNIGGMYKVTCTQIGRDDIYENLVIDLNYEVAAPDIPMYDSLYIDSLGIDPNDIVIEDLSLLEDYYGVEAMVKANKPRRAYRKNAAWRRIREATDMPNEILATRGQKNSDSIMHWHLADISWKDRSTGMKISFGGELEKHSVQEVTYHEDKATDYKKQTTIDKSYDVWKISAGLTVGKDVFDAHDLQKVDKFKNIGKALKNLALKKPAKKKPMIGGKILWPIPGMPAISLAISITGNISFEGAICADMTIEHYHPQTKSVYEYKDGKEIYYPTEEIKSGWTKPTSYKAYGSLSLSAQLRAGVGIEITGTGLGGDIGIGITAKLVATLPFWDLQQHLDQETSSIIEDDAKITVESFFFVEGGIYWSPAGVNVFSAYHTFCKKQFFKEPIYPVPTVWKDECKHTYKIEADEEGTVYNLYNVSVVFSHLWMLGLPSDKCYARILMYNGSYDGACTVLKEKRDYVDTERKVETLSYRNFQLRLPTGEYEKLIFVPCIYDAEHHHYYEFRNAAMFFGNATPSFKHVKHGSRVSLSLTKYFAEEVNDEDAQKDFLKEYGLSNLPAWMVNLDNWFFHEFAIALEVKNLGMVDHYGMKVLIQTYNLDEKKRQTLIEKDVNIKKRNTYMKAGKKTLVYSFITNYSKAHLITLTPYTVDAGGEKTYSETVFGPYTIQYDEYQPYPKWDWKNWPGAMIQADVFAD